jgi:glycosyltransferase involved in cell wall biosynthesis
VIVDVPEPPVLAILPWGLLIEDFLDANELSLEDFCTDFTGSWLFGYVAALRTAGVGSVIVCVSARVKSVSRRRHAATDTDICIIPASRFYRWVRSRMRSPYGRSAREVFPVRSALRPFLSPLLFATKELAPYRATPILRLARELRRYRCSVMLCQEYEFPRYDVCVALGRMLNVPVYASFQGGDYQRWRAERVTRPAAIRLGGGLIAASGAERERLRRRYRARNVATIPNPVDLDAWRPADRTAAREALGIAHGDRVAAWHGRVEVRKKGLDTLIDAWSRLGSSIDGTDLALLMIGTGGDAPELRRLLAEARVSNVIWIDRYLHRPEEIAQHLSAADAYVFPSRHEGFPLAPIEAMACGLGVISTDVSGIRDVLAEGERAGGVIVPGNAPEMLAGELARVLGDLALCRRLGRSARTSAQRFGTAAVGSQLRTFIFGDAPSAGA